MRSTGEDSSSDLYSSWLSFFSGAPLLNQIVYKSAERFLARYTDVLVTINEEDFNAARKFRLRKRGRVYKVHGVGVHTNVGVQPGGQEHYRHRLYVREKLAIHRSAIVVVSVGELNRNKNNEVIIRALGKLERNDIYYVLCGEGKLKDDLYRLAKRLGLGERVRFLGYRTDIEDILLMADIFVLPSFREGLSSLLFAPLGRELGGFSEWIFEVDPFIIAGELEQPQIIRWDIVRQMALYMVIIGQIDNLNRVEHIQQYTGCWAV